MLTFSNTKFRLCEELTVAIDALQLHDHDLIVLLGHNGSGKTALARALAGELPLISGEVKLTESDGEALEGKALERNALGYRAQLVSFEGQQELFEADYNLRNSDATTAKEEQGLLAQDLLEGLDPKSVHEAVVALNLAPLLQRPIRTLSGGEGRKILLARALGAKPDLLIFDCPFDALDVESRKQLLEIIGYIHKFYREPMVLIVNRPDEIPSELTALGLISDLSLTKLDTREALLQDPEAQALLYCGSLPPVALPEPPAQFAVKLADPNAPIVALNKVNITYDRPVLKDLTFTVNPGEHWQIVGPNGAGKSTLLSLITGDNPLVYVNDVTVFGYKRGTGESIWDIKKCYGYVSGALHLDYRVSSPVLHVVLSGFYDSIGLYQQPGDHELAVARSWLKLVGLEHDEMKSFKALSFGQQRMLLIVRSLVKQPPLLILDEPLQGLDAYGRALVRSFITYIIERGKTSILFVSHHEEDAPAGINHRLTFVRDDDGVNYHIVQEALNLSRPD